MMAIRSGARSFRFHAFEDAADLRAGIDLLAASTFNDANKGGVSARSFSVATAVLMLSSWRRIAPQLPQLPTVLPCPACAAIARLLAMGGADPIIRR
jgi:hypothetical protein